MGRPGSTHPDAKPGKLARPVARTASEPKLPELITARPDRAQDLLHQLVHELLSKRTVTDVSPRTDSQDVLVDVQVEGVRCLLTRTRSEPVLAKPVLSAREIEIARMVANGLPNKTIAAVLDLSPWTVSTYVRRMFLKLGVHCRPAMIARLAGEGVLRVERGAASASVQLGWLALIANI